ncbi:5136_t:CDS:2 [Entrophospora sp. SA101]|nr:5136_t:CDS:2 [Entrophospora sp. SA101]
MSGAFMSHNERINAFQEYFEELHDKNSYILQQTCIPTFLVYIYGPYFGIAGAVMGQKVTIDPLVEGSLILKHGNRFWIDQISRVFCALRKANNHLDEYYSQIPKFQVSKEVTRQKHFPFLRNIRQFLENL